MKRLYQSKSHWGSEEGAKKGPPFFVPIWHIGLVTAALFSLR